MIEKAQLGVYRESSDVKIPVYAHNRDAGFDLYAYKFENDEGVAVDSEYIDMLPHSKAMVHTGLHFNIPNGYYVSINPRSGLACKSMVTVMNAPGIIDSNYKGEIIVCLHNASMNTVRIYRDTRVAQAILHQYTTADFLEVNSIDELGVSDRGSNGFGSTGLK